MANLSNTELLMLRSMLEKVGLNNSLTGVKEGASAPVEEVVSGSESFKSVGDGDLGSDGLGSSASSSLSWADQVEEEEIAKRGKNFCAGRRAEGVKNSKQVEGGCVVEQGGAGNRAEKAAVSMPVSCVVKDARVKAMKFGGFRDEYVAKLPGLEPTSSSFFKNYVRVPRVIELKRYLEKNLNVKLPRECAQDLALATHAPGSVPSAFVDGSRRVKGFSGIGDAAATMALVTYCFAEGVEMSSVQFLRGSRLSTMSMSSAYVKMGFLPYSIYPSGVDLERTKVGADLFESVLGVLVWWRGASIANDYLRWANIY